MKINLIAGETFDRPSMVESTRSFSGFDSTEGDRSFFIIRKGG